MALTGINSEDRLVQKTMADYLHDRLDWETVYAHNGETFGPGGTLGRMSEREVVLVRALRVALTALNPKVPAAALEQAIDTLTRTDFSRSLIQHNRDFYRLIRNGVPVEWQDQYGIKQYARAQVLDFRTPRNNRFLAVRELRIQGVRVPHYNRRADLVCFVNGLPLVFVELKAVYKNIRTAFDHNLTDYLHPSSISHAFHHNAFLVVSNGDRARYGSITSKWEHFVEWKRSDERDAGRLDTQALLDGMLAKDRLLDLVENFVLFDDSRAGGVRKIVARNHQVLGVNKALASVQRQEQLKLLFPPGQREVSYTISRRDLPHVAERATGEAAFAASSENLNTADDFPPLIKRAHPDLGRLGVFWHTQGSGKSYSMAFFAEKVRRMIPGNFTFVVMTDREDLDDQIRRTFVGTGVADEQTPRAGSGHELRALLRENHRFVFSLIHKFNQPVTEPYTNRDDIIVMSDEAHRTQAGKFARNMRLALPNASFIGFTGTPLFQYDELTRRIFGTYVSRYDFKRSEEDQSTVKLVYDNRGEKLGLEHLDLNDRIAAKIDEAELDPDQAALLERLLGQDYEVITADDRLDKLADDFVEHCSTRWQSGKSMLVCIDKVTCARMLQRIQPRWAAKAGELRAGITLKNSQMVGAGPDARERLIRQLEDLRGRTDWMETTCIEIIISEAQNEVRDFERWGFDIIPHRVVMKAGFETADGKMVAVDDAFKDPQHPFRVAIVCAMWLTGFDVECLSTLYIDKPMKSHSLMQAIARANRVYPGKECGVIVDYNGMLKSLRAALAQYALGDEDDGSGGDGGGIVVPIEQLVASLLEAIEAAEAHLRSLGFEPRRLTNATGFPRIEALKDAVDALHSSDDARRRFEIIARQVFSRFKALVMEPGAAVYAARHDDIEAIYKKLQERRDTADVTGLLKALHRIVNESIRAQQPGDDRADGLLADLSQMDFSKLCDEFASKASRRHTAVQDIRDIVDAKLAAMLDANPLRMDYYRKYQELVADYNREKDRATVEETFARLIELAKSLDVEQQRAVEEGLTEDELALFDLLRRENITKSDRERLKQASRQLLASLRELLAPIRDWTQNTTTQAEVKVFILDTLWQTLPRPPFSDEETEALAGQVYDYVWARSASGPSLAAGFAG